MAADAARIRELVAKVIWMAVEDKPQADIEAELGRFAAAVERSAIERCAKLVCVNCEHGVPFLANRVSHVTGIIGTVSGRDAERIWPCMARRIFDDAPEAAPQV
jgi:hypothetical protein